MRQDENKVQMAFSCGQCLPCLQKRASGWSFRLRKEGEIASLSLFVTLTYNTDHVPITRRGFMSLDKDRIVRNKNYEKELRLWKENKRKRKPKEMVFQGSHLTNFFKMLRKTEPNIRYYAVGEYGGQTYRPHYHIILYNASIQGVIDAWQVDGKPLGECYFGTVEGASIGYVLKYISKTKQIPMHENDDRVPEYCRMSKGLGANYLNDKTKAWHKADLENRQYMPIEEGKKCAMPRYYRNRIYTDQEKGYLSGHNERYHKESQEKELLELGDQYNHIIDARKKDNWRKLREKRQSYKKDPL